MLTQLLGMRMEEEPLADTAERVLVLLDCCKKIRDRKARNLADFQLSQFKSWALSVGVFAAQHASLDYRLRTAPDSRALVETSLDTIYKHLLGTLKTSSKVSDKGFDALSNAPRSKVLTDAKKVLLKSKSNRSLGIKQLKLVDTMINTLHQNTLGMRRAINGKTLVKTPKLLDFDKKYAIIRERRGDGADLSFLVDDIRFDIGTEFDDFLRKALMHRWFRFRSNDEEDLDDERKSYRQMLLKRCVTTISARRRQLAYFQAYYGHEEAFAPQLKVASFKPQFSHLVPRRTSLSTFADDSFGFRFGGPLDVPPPPKLAGNEEEEACPYCCLVLPAETFSTQKRAELWERHLLDDLQPYICLFENCDKAGRTYSSFAEWREHIMDVHYRGWECSLHTRNGRSDAVGDKVLTFDTLEKLEMHLRISHPDLDPWSASDRLQHGRQMAVWHQWCFVCGQAIPEFETLLKHIANHLESMSLLALPWRDDITVEEAIASDKATFLVATDVDDSDAIDTQLDGTCFCGWEETDEVMMDPVRKLDKHEFASLLMAMKEIPQDRLQILEAWVQDSCLNASGWSRGRRNWSLPLIVVKTITKLRKNAVWSQARHRKLRIRDRIPWYRHYTVGWICALPSAYEASKAMLDYEYRLPFPNSNYDPNDDPNTSYNRDSYVFGRIGHHDVAIACMASDYYETSSVSDVLKDMRGFFPFLRFYFMVGIGGGSSSTLKDIQLRDVTVDDPAIDSGAVVQYDSGGMVRGGECVQARSLNTRMLPEDLQINGFHCLGIRCISGYADSYKNDIWQPCAAATAAEYAKKLLHIFPPVPSAIFPDVWYRLTKYLPYTKGIDIEEDSTSADGGMRITLEMNDADRLGQYWTFQPRDAEGSWTMSTMALPDSVLGVHPGDETRLRLEPAAFAMGQQWQITSRGGGAVNIWNRSLGSEGYLCTRGDPAELTLSEKNENDASQLWRLHPVGIVGRQCSQSDDMVIG
ncbi:hypothetical protein CFAM422_006180 [Trichoderma lentiforme]|uniref:C2H2-type domain-containing protein n=1 Tax=Trichoderma lentiforme TaxID=1567552 RepID=A0A9P4XFE4_9HYPO|nr:hypothetical protein CFAM422_006180 [Trichoderma lentiforme]